jgi:hypothetical protein
VPLPHLLHQILFTLPWHVISDEAWDWYILFDGDDFIKIVFNDLLRGQGAHDGLAVDKVKLMKNLTAAGKAWATLRFARAFLEGPLGDDVKGPVLANLVKVDKEQAMRLEPSPLEAPSKLAWAQRYVRSGCWRAPYIAGE